MTSKNKHMIEVRIESVRGVQIVEFSAEEVLAYHGEKRTWQEVVMIQAINTPK